MYFFIIDTAKKCEFKTLTSEYQLKKNFLISSSFIKHDKNSSFDNIFLFKYFRNSLTLILANNILCLVQYYSNIFNKDLILSIISK